MTNLETMIHGSNSCWVEDEFSALDAIAQAELVKTGRASPIDLVDAAILRIERSNPVVNAVTATDVDQAKERARVAGGRGILAGVPTLLKDVMAYPGLPLEFGSRAFAGQKAYSGSKYSQAIEDAGLVVLGKSATSELGLLGTTEPLARGATRNPWDLSRSTGGSSGGAVAAVASGMVSLAHASDGGGSVRGPAALCGLFGFKPSRGRHVSAGPVTDSPFGRILSEHCVSHSVRDSAAWLAVTERQDTEMPFSRVGYVSAAASQPLRIGVYRQTAFGRHPHADVAACLEQTAALCESLGHSVVESTGPQFDALATSDAFFSLSGASIAGLCAQMRQVSNAFDANLLEPFTRELAERVAADPAGAVQRALTTFAAAEREANRCFQSMDILLCPTTPFTAFLLGHISPVLPAEEIIAFTQELAGYTAIASIAGWCAMSVPLHTSPEGMPIGMHFAAPAGRDAQLLQLAYELEGALPWKHRKPGRNGTS